MGSCSNGVYLENNRVNRIDKRGAEINFHSNNKIDKINIKLEDSFRADEVLQNFLKQTAMN